MKSNRLSLRGIKKESRHDS